MPAATDRKKHAAPPPKPARSRPAGKATAAKKLARSAAKAIGKAAKPAAKPATAPPAAKLRGKLGLTQVEFAKLLPTSPRTIATLEQGATPTDTVARRLTELGRLTRALAEVVREEAIGGWLRTPNPAFDGLKPVEVVDRGEADRLWEMIYFLRSGVAS